MLPNTTGRQVLNTTNIITQLNENKNVIIEHPTNFKNVISVNIFRTIISYAPLELNGKTLDFHNAPTSYRNINLLIKRQLQTLLAICEYS